MLAVCPNCGKAIDVQIGDGCETQCSLCHAFLHAQQNGEAVHLFMEEPAQAEDVNKQLAQIGSEKDPVKKHAALLALDQQYPNQLSVRYAILLHGRLHERSSKRLDFSVIKCYLLNPYEEPKNHKAETRKAFYEELFHGEELERCLSLAKDKEQFMKTYLQDLCERYIALFLMGSSRYSGSLLGFMKFSTPEKRLRVPIEAMIARMEEDALMTSAEKQLLQTALRNAFARRFSGASIE